MTTYQFCHRSSRGQPDGAEDGADLSGCAGVSQEAIDLADQLVTIPMQGCMVDSFNVSVAAAIIMWEARSQRERLLSCGHADLTEQQRETLLALMMLRNKVLAENFLIPCADEADTWQELSPYAKCSNGWTIVLDVTSQVCSFASTCLCVCLTATSSNGSPIFKVPH